MLAHADRWHIQQRLPLLHTSKLSKIAYPVTYYRAHPSQTATAVRQWTEADKAELSVLENGCLTSLWPLAVASSADERPVAANPFGGIAKYNGPRRPCQLLGKIDCTAA